VRLEVGYCAPRGIPHSTFLGRVVGPGEPLWLGADRDKALWWLIRDRQTCSGCGTRAEEWEDDLDAYTAEPHFCRGCEVRASADESFSKQRGHYRRGTSIQLRPRRKGG
jgi:hypothetical protein